MECSYKLPALQLPHCQLGMLIDWGFFLGITGKGVTIEKLNLDAPKLVTFLRSFIL
jgi:hypothetical protein